MKPRKLTLISLTLLALIVFGTVVILYAPKPPPPLIAEQVRVLPKHIDMLNPANIEVQLKLFEGKNTNQAENVVDQIDNSTVRLEGIPIISSRVVYTASGEPKDFFGEFDGGLVRNMIWVKIFHMGIPLPPHTWNPIAGLELAMWGELYDGRQWTGTGTVNIINWATVEPPPPPPP